MRGEMHFNYRSNPQRVLFGAGRLAELGAVVGDLRCKRALVITTPEQSELGVEATDLLNGSGAGIFDRATMHTPIEITEAALETLKHNSSDCLVAIGGGSTTGLGKALALRTGLPLIAVPTTYAGSEMTPILGETKDGRKTTLSSPKVLPQVVIYDVNLTLTLPISASVASGINAIAHAAEALYARDSNPITSLMAEEAMRAMTSGLRGVSADPDNVSFRSEALYAAWLCGSCLGAVGMALHHKICHVLGGTFGLPHAETHCVVLPHVIAYNAPAIPQALKRMSRALDTKDPAAGVFRLCQSLGAPTALKNLGMSETDIDRATHEVLRNTYWNPRPVEAGPVSDMLRRAWLGTTPR